MPDIANRLKAAREGLGLSQQAIAEHCGITARSQRNYEAGERLPDAQYLARLADAGVDVVYVLTGERSGKQPAADAAEQVLLDSYRRCKPEARAHLIQTAALLSAGLPPAAPATAAKKAAPASINMRMSSTHDGSVQVGYAGGKVTVKKTKS